MLAQPKHNRLLIALAAIAFFYAVIGNYVALPGYLRFLERGGASEAGNSLDLAVLIGASKTIAWMLAFNLGAICLYFAVLRNRCPEYLKYGAAISVTWMIFWVLPELPRPGAPFFILFGSLILALILLIAFQAARSAEPTGNARRQSFCLATAALFFAFATWDVCGLGSTGRILHPDQVVLSRSQLLLQTQVSKLMLAFVLAWFFGALSLRK